MLIIYYMYITVINANANAKDSSGEDSVLTNFQGDQRVTKLRFSSMNTEIEKYRFSNWQTSSFYILKKWTLY